MFAQVRSFCYTTILLIPYNFIAVIFMNFMNLRSLLQDIWLPARYYIVR